MNTPTEIRGSIINPTTQDKCLIQRLDQCTECHRTMGTRAEWNQIRDSWAGLRHMEIIRIMVKSAAVDQSMLSSAAVDIITAAVVTDVAVDEYRPPSHANISGVLSVGE